MVKNIQDALNILYPNGVKDINSGFTTSIPKAKKFLPPSTDVIKRPVVTGAGIRNILSKPSGWLGPALSAGVGGFTAGANWKKEGSDAITRLDDILGAIGNAGATTIGAILGGTVGHPVIGATAGGLTGGAVQGVANNQAQIRRDANRNWNTYLTKDQFARNVYSGIIKLPEGVKLDDAWNAYLYGKGLNKTNSSGSKNNKEATTDSGSSNMYQNPYTGKLDSIENIINNARANGQGYNGELDNQDLPDIQSLNANNTPADTEGSIAGNVDLNGMLDRYRRQQELQKPYIEGLQNLINNYNNLQRNAFLTDVYLAGMSDYLRSPYTGQLVGKYNPIRDEASRVDLLNKLAQGQIGVDDIENEMRGNIALAQQAGIDPRVAMANPKLVNALASIENAKTSAAARRYAADASRETKLANIQSNAMIQKAKLDGNWKLALMLQEMKNDGRLQSAIVNAVSFGADPSVIYSALQGYGGGSIQGNNLQPPREIITTPTGGVEASRASSLLDNVKR
jgi:hypothetical protein